MISQQKSYLKRDPFYVDPTPKAHYYPTEKKSLSNNQKKTALSPTRKNSKQQDEKERLSYNDELFLKGGNSFTSKLNQDGDESGSSKFDESWPSTDRPSSLTDEEHPLDEYLSQKNGDRLRDLKKTLEFPQKDLLEKTRRSDVSSNNGNVRQNDSSTLQKYIDRFRSGQPMSRQERQSATTSSKKDFWWLSDGSMTESSTPKDYSPGIKRTKRFTPHSPISPYKGHSEKLSIQALAAHGLDDTTKLLQEKADKLLDSASSVASSDPIVSTDGLGSSLSFNSTVYSVEERPFRPSFARKWENQEKRSYQIPKPQGRQPTGPEDDVLYQWRLKRRMEQARDSAIKAPPVKFGYKDKSTEQKEIDHKLEEFKQKLSRKGVELPSDEFNVSNDSGLHHGAVQFTPAPQSQPFRKISSEPQKSFPIASPSIPETGAEKLQPHFHLTCDLLPCAHQSQRQTPVEVSKRVETSSNVKFTENVILSHKHKTTEEKSYSEKQKAFDSDDETGSDKYRFLEAEKPDVEEKVKVESKSRSAEECLQNIDDSDSCKSERSRKSEDRKSESSVKSDHKQSRRGQRKEGSQLSALDQGVHNKNSSMPVLQQSGKPIQAKPVVENAIGQVVKDRLFNISTSTVMSSIDSEPGSPPQKPRFKDQKQTDNSDVCYDSDGDYPEDQLLHMLRQQRGQYEEQLRHIDDLLAKIEPGSS